MTAPSEKDVNCINSPEYNPEIKLTEDSGKVYLNFTLDSSYYNHKVKVIGSEILGKAKTPKADFDNPDGSLLKIDKDYFGNKRSGENILAGPFSNLDTAKVLLKIW